MKSFALILSICFVGGIASAKEIVCLPTKGASLDAEISKEKLIKSKTHLKINGREISRCSLESSGRVTCDTYEADEIKKTETGFGSIITKYYYFKGQFNVQTFQEGKSAETMTFVEDNGRGTVYFGLCGTLGAKK